MDTVDDLSRWNKPDRNNQIVGNHARKSPYWSSKQQCRSKTCKETQADVFHWEMRCGSDVQISIVVVIVFLVALLSRLWYLDHFSSVIPDESQVIRQICLYVKQKFFLDNEPPLGKLLLSGWAWWNGWNGHLNFTVVEEYSESVLVWRLRLFPVLCGSLLAPLSLLIVLELKPKHLYVAVIAPLMIIADCGLLVWSCVVNSGSIQLCLLAVSVFSVLKATNTNNRITGSVWMITTGISLGTVVSTAYIGWMTAVLVVCLVFMDYWRKLPDQSFTHVELFWEFLYRVSMVCLLPVCVYIAVFYVHLSILCTSGPHDHLMTSAFQASLQGGLSSVTFGQPNEVVYGSQITLKRTHGIPCWLHSHHGLYPLKYPDDRVSSNQQQVSCATQKHVNNWWIVKNPHRNYLHADSPAVAVKHGDVIQLVHGMTRRALHSHDVAAPVTSFCQEVSCYIDYGISAPPLNQWKLEVVNRQEVGDIWQTLHSVVRLVHLDTAHTLKTTGAQLPDWGGHHFEVVSDRIHHQAAALWNVEEHKYTKG